jgi:hypothetical protein
MPVLLFGMTNSGCFLARFLSHLSHLGPERTKMPEVKMEVQIERKKPTSHKPACLCWRCGRGLAPKEDDRTTKAAAEAVGKDH